jgi:hypothetical protein
MVMIVNLEASEFVNERGLIRCASLLTSGHYAGEHEEASFYRRLIFNPEFSRSSSASKSPGDGVVGILIHKYHFSVLLYFQLNLGKIVEAFTGDK